MDTQKCLSTGKLKKYLVKNIFLEIFALKMYETPRNQLIEFGPPHYIPLPQDLDKFPLSKLFKYIF